MNKLTYILTLSILLVLGGCSSSKNSTLSSNTPVKKVNKDQFDRVFFEAQTEKLKGDNLKAAEYFKSALKIDNTNAACYYELGTYYFNQSKFKDAEDLITRAVFYSPENKWYRILLADIYQNQKKWPQALVAYDKLIELYPNERDYYFSEASLFIVQGKANDALKVYDKVEKQFGAADDLVLQKYKIYYAQGKYDKAIEEVNKLIAKDPDNIQYLEIIAETYLKQGKDDKAFEIFEKLQTLHPDNPMIQLAMAEFYEKKGNKEKTLASLKLAFANPDLNIDTKIQILYTKYLMQKDVDSITMNEAMELTALMNKAHPKEAKAHAIYGDFLAQAKKMPEAREEYRKSLELRNDVFAVWQQVLGIDIDLKEFKTLEEESAKAIEIFPNQPIVFFYNGIARNELKKYKEAIEAFNSGLAIITDNKPLETQFYSYLAESYYRLKDFPNSDKNFDKALALDPNDKLALNNYAYYLSVRNEKLDKAEEMSKKSLQLDPSNASYQDTYGWILFKLGRYTEAEDWIKKAINQDHSAEVTEHYGDVLFKLGKTEQAVEYWQKAKKLGSDNPQLDQKIEAKKIIE